MENSPLLIDFKSVCALLSIGQTHFFNLREAGKFPIRPIRLGRAVRYDRRQVEQWIGAGCPANWEGGRK